MEVSGRARQSKKGGGDQWEREGKRVRGRDGSDEE